MAKLTPGPIEWMNPKSEPKAIPSWKPRTASDLAAEEKYASRKGVTSFAPRTGNGLFLYAVTLVDHPGVVKIGRTTRWSQRRHAYADFNLRAGDGIAESIVWCINEEWADLADLEGQVIEGMFSRFARRKGMEWFMADIDAASEVIEAVLALNDVLAFADRETAQ